MEELKISIDGDHYLSTRISEKDINNMLEYLNDDAIYNNTLMIPKIYTKEKAIWFINLCNEKIIKYNRAMGFHIRNANDNLIGSIELLGNYTVNSHKDEIGYWIAKPYRGRGIMTKAINTFTNYVFSNYNLVRLEATIYDFNLTSQHLIEKCGFQYEGTLKKAYLKDGKYIDAKLYAIVK